MARPKKNNITNIKDAKKAAKSDEFIKCITKITFSDKDMPEIHYNLDKDRATFDSKAKGKDKPLDSFLKSMQALAAIFCDVCEIGDKVDETLIHTVNFSDKGVVISAKVELTEHGIPQPLCINTPYLPYESNNGGYSLPDYAIKQLNELRQQAVRYLQGDAAETQLEMAL